MAILLDNGCQIHSSGRRYTPKYKYDDGVVDGNYTFYGYIPESERTEEENEEVSKSLPPPLRIEGTTEYKNAEGVEKICIFDLWKHPLIVSANGFAYPGNHQLTGSCVGAGGGNGVASLAFADAVIRNDAENPLIPFWLLPYGRSRYYLSGRYSKGEGSTGATFAKALREDGVLWATYEGLPKFTHTDGLVWGASVEMDWSAGRVDEKYASIAKNYLVKSTAVCKDADDVRDAICNYYPVAIASNWGGQMNPQVVNGVLLNTRVTTWSHQMSVHAWWLHPQLGEIYWIQNQWGLTAHGTDPAAGPGGGFWVRKADINWICQGQEAIAYSQYNGYPAQKITSWYL